MVDSEKPRSNADKIILSRALGFSKTDALVFFSKYCIDELRMIYDKKRKSNVKLNQERIETLDREAVLATLKV